VAAALTETACVLVLDRVDSTNAEALRRASAGEQGPLWIVARQQTAGRGRRGRAWVSAPGNLHATLLLTDPSPPAAAPQLGFVAGLAIHDAAAAAAPALASSLALKWPNDLLCKGRKVAGILIEGEGTPIAVAIGIGVNCRRHPEGTEYPATDFAVNGVAVTADALLDALAIAMQERLAQWNRGNDFAAIRGAWLARACGLGEQLAVRLAGRETSGSFESIDGTGRLMLRHGDHSLEAIAAGEVFPVTQIA
jgi:BirA family transcriptional regulator, biotin operon repressor / biotin---[acetyl-CoA-carboxylase] ligase